MPTRAAARPREGAGGWRSLRVGDKAEESNWKKNQRRKAGDVRVHRFLGKITERAAVG